MRFMIDRDAGLFTMVAETSDDEEFVAEIASHATAGQLMDYYGRSENEAGRLELMFNVGGLKTRKTEGNMTRDVSEGGFDFVVVASDDDGDDSIRVLRDAIFFGGGGLIFIEESIIDGRPAIVSTVGHCRVCGAPIATRGECEWKTCNTCAGRCDHVYKRGAIHGGDAGDIALGEFCEKCGSVNHDVPSNTNEADIEAELGITLVNPGNAEEKIAAVLAQVLAEK